MVPLTLLHTIGIREFNLVSPLGPGAAMSEKKGGVRSTTLVLLDAIGNRKFILVGPLGPGPAILFYGVRGQCRTIRERTTGQVGAIGRGGSHKNTW